MRVNSVTCEAEGGCLRVQAQAELYSEALTQNKKERGLSGRQKSFEEASLVVMVEFLPTCVR